MDKWIYGNPNFEYEQILNPFETAWYGHIFFAYDLVVNTKPKTIVELGTHFGHSFFSFCQAIKDHNIPCSAFAVDTWIGDEHTGGYTDDIYKTVVKVTEDIYQKIDLKLLRKTFDQAVEEFKDNSIDLLHIDGLHTYDAVKHDFYNWLPKVNKETGIILMHDIKETRDDFGVYILWEELKKEFDTFEFYHSHGLGIVAFSKNLAKKFKEQDNWQLYYSLKSDDKVKGLNLKRDEQEKYDLSMKVIALEKENHDLHSDLNQKDEDFKYLNNLYNNTNHILYQKETELNQIKNSRFWKIRLKYIRIAKSTKAIIARPRRILGKVKRTIKKGLHYLRAEGLISFLNRTLAFLKLKKLITFHISRNPNAINFDYHYQQNIYIKWIDDIEVSYKDSMKHSHKQLISEMKFQPKISILLPVYNTDEIFLRKAIFSVINQYYSNWELCIVDDMSTIKIIKPILEEFTQFDKRIKLEFSNRNEGISATTNKAFQKSSGEFILFLDHDDELEREALMEIVLELNKNPDLEFIYSDDDKIDIYGNRYDPQFKPDWSPELLLSYCYLSHFKAVKREIFEKLNGFKSDFDGAQDYEFCLRLAEICPDKKICHIPKILYHWRSVPGSTAASANHKPKSIEKGRQAVVEALNRSNNKAEVIVPNFAMKANLGIYTLKFKNEDIKDKVTIIIPTKDKVELLQKCIGSIHNKTTYKNYEILVISNNSKEKATYDFFRKNKIKYIDISTPSFNFSYINNEAVKHVESEYILFLNNDIEVISPNWLIDMMGTITLDKKIGAVGAKLLYSDNRIQHSGVVMGLNEYTAGHAHKLMDYDSWGYMNFNMVIRNYSAVTAACLLTRKDIFEEVKGFNETIFAKSYNDVDLCLKILTSGYRIVNNPNAILFHHEGQTRGFGDDHNEVRALREKWEDLIINDPFYNINLSLHNEYFYIRQV